ncbi:MAG TPA: hypothetical protein VGI74_11120 [Streptosporangiaceae bacterium]
MSQLPAKRPGGHLSVAIFLGIRTPGGGLPEGDPLGIDLTLRELLGPGDGICLEIGCGTGARKPG